MTNYKKTTLTLILTAILLLSLTSCTTFHKTTFEPTPKNLRLNQYTIDATLNPEEKTLQALQQISYINTENIELKELYFHIYSNAFKSKDTAPISFDSMEDTPGENRSQGGDSELGWTEIQSIFGINGASKTYLKGTLQGEGETILKIDLPKALKPGERCILEFHYKVHIPRANERFGYGENYFNLGNWYPVAAVFDHTGWNLDKYYDLGDPFYSDIADYTVTIKAPKPYTIAASGQLLENGTQGKQQAWKFHGKGMRDFAFVASPKFKMASDKVGGTTVQSYYYEGDEEGGKAALQYGVKSIKAFNKLYGKYPYPTYTIAETEFPTGMEYPGIVYISDKYYRGDTARGEKAEAEESAYGSYNNVFPYNYLAITVVHETAHQWWYAIVGNDQIDEAWLDEGFATYSESLFAEELYGKALAERYFKSTVELPALRSRMEKPEQTNIVKSLREFENWYDYGHAVYDGGAMLLGELRKEVGDKTFFKIMKTYYEQMKFKNAVTGDFIRISEEVSGKNMDEFFNKWLKSK